MTATEPALALLFARLQADDGAAAAIAAELCRQVDAEPVDEEDRAALAQLAGTLSAAARGPILRAAVDALVDVLGDWDRLPEQVRDGLYPLLHDWRTR